MTCMYATRMCVGGLVAAACCCMQPDGGRVWTRSHMHYRCSIRRHSQIVSVAIAFFRRSSLSREYEVVLSVRDGVNAREEAMADQRANVAS
jgi:hypothetical protein